MSLINPVPLDPSDAFAALRSIVEDWRSNKRKTTTAGLKPALAQAMPGFSEADYGYAAFRDFVAGAEAADLVTVHRLPSGHSVVLLPGETVEEVAAETVGSEASATTPEGGSQNLANGPVRLKQDVWSCLVDWQDGYARLWDRTVGRAFMFPTDGEGRPAWPGDTERFVPIDPIGQETQMAWMRSWAETLPSEVGGALRVALDQSAPPGQFRRELGRLSLVGPWRAELQRRAQAHLEQWAQANHVPPGSLIDHRPRRAVGRADGEVAPSPAERAKAGTESTAAKSVEHGADTVEGLRRFLHRTIDRMSFSELSSLQVRAEHFLEM